MRHLRHLRCYTTVRFLAEVVPVNLKRSSSGSPDPSRFVPSRPRSRVAYVARGRALECVYPLVVVGAAGAPGPDWVVPPLQLCFDAPRANTVDRSAVTLALTTFFATNNNIYYNPVKTARQSLHGIRGGLPNVSYGFKR